jgi:ABC-type amino acid transport substrate-binding protein
MAVVPYRVALAALALLLVLPAAGQERPAREAAAARELPGARPAAPRSALPPLAVDASVTLKRIRDSATLRIGVREASVPFSFVAAQGEPQG